MTKNGNPHPSRSSGFAFDEARLLLLPCLASGFDSRRRKVKAKSGKRKRNQRRASSMIS
jgi:hypothetical protein